MVQELSNSHRSHQLRQSAMFNDWENKRTAHRLYWDLAANLLSIFGLFEAGADLVRALPPRTPTLWINRRMKKSTSCFTGCLIVDAPDAQCSRWMLLMYDRVVVGSVVHTHEDRTYIKHQNYAAPLAPPVKRRQVYSVLRVTSNMERKKKSLNCVAAQLP